MMQLIVNAGRRYAKIDKNIYGHFAEHLGNGIYGGIYVGENSPIPNVRGIRTDVVTALKNIKAPQVRWPGGCFAEYYNWRDGIGPKAERKCIVNTTWGGVVEDNAFGTHEFLDFCHQVGCAPYIACNVGTGSPREAAEWVEYITMKGKSPMADLRRKNGREEPWPLEYFGIGNENWGFMRAEYYADVYRQFATFARSSGDKRLYKVACGANGDDYEWTETLMRMVGKQMSGLSLHYYTMPKYYRTEEYPWEEKAQAVGIDRGQYYRSLRRALYMDELIARHKHVMDRFDKEGRVGIVVDEWGTWHRAEEGTNPGFLFQQNTMRDAIVAAVTLNIFNNHSDRVRMANLAQMVNVLQSVILTKDEQMVLTPTYHVFDLFKGHQDATRIESYVQQDVAGTEEAKVPTLHVSASESDAGEVRVTLVNLSADEGQQVGCYFAGRAFRTATFRYIMGDINSYNGFGEAETISVRSMPDARITDNHLTLNMPACCVMELLLV